METKKLKPFDLEKAKQGAKLITRNGHPARIICWDREHKTDHIVALVEYTENGETTEEGMTYTDQGRYYDNGNESYNDLLMAPTTVERWMNVYKNTNGEYYNGSLYDSEQEALIFKNKANYIATTKITWED